MKLKPLHDRIIVQVAAKEEVSAGGIILPDAAQEKPQRGTVLAVGPGKVLDSGKLAPVDVNVGDVVLYGRYGGTEVTVSGKDYTILRADDVLAVVSGGSVAKAATPKKQAVSAPATAKKAVVTKVSVKNAAGKKSAGKPPTKKAAAKKAAAKPVAKKSVVKKSVAKPAMKKMVSKPTAKKASAKKTVKKVGGKR